MFWNIHRMQCSKVKFRAVTSHYFHCGFFYWLLVRLALSLMSFQALVPIYHRPNWLLEIICLINDFRQEMKLITKIFQRHWKWLRAEYLETLQTFGICIMHLNCDPNNKTWKQVLLQWLDELRALKFMHPALCWNITWGTDYESKGSTGKSGASCTLQRHRWDKSVMTQH